MEAHSYRHFSVLAFGYCGVGGGLGRLFHVLKQFASEGVRLVFIGEWQGYYDAITLENDFLGKMEAVMTKYRPGSGLRLQHPAQRLASPPPDHPGHEQCDHRLFLGAGARAQRLPPLQVLSAVATIDTTPLPLGPVQPAWVIVSPHSLHPLLNPGSATGYQQGAKGKPPAAAGGFLVEPTGLEPVTS